MIQVVDVPRVLATRTATNKLKVITLTTLCNCHSLYSANAEKVTQHLHRHDQYPEEAWNNNGQSGRLSVRFHQSTWHVRTTFKFHNSTSGSYSGVVLGQHKQTQENVAIKIIDKRKLTFKETERLRRELEINAQLEHENIVVQREVYQSRDDCSIVMDLYVLKEFPANTKLRLLFLAEF